ncbi:MAG: type II toxin-antitoxin system VapC family toxin [Methylobacterium sp.]|uniref:type II toxin-antitoxin system VapC family toxin n=1 Tax=Methylobacterium sp. TaxID=409 RepID=UPI0025F2ADA0|nr:type II toxin-antitoxin system VapC family toxin [Methylobacterium sp.]MBX9931960.1 type II toxin-antitoxin system VapC family toxin [Methylobacterium sp.]
MKYLLDSNVVIALLKRQETVTERIYRHSRRDHGLSSIVIHELLFGAYRSLRIERGMAALEGLRLTILDFNADDARKAAEIRAHLATAGTPIGPYDVLIAGQALQRGLVVVTRNTREFSRVPGLAVENWEDEAG